MSTPLTDREIICEWMEPDLPKPNQSESPRSQSAMGWWYGGRPYSGDEPAPWRWYPRELDLDALWEVEERLTREQCEEYTVALVDSTRIGTVEYGGAQCHRWHADAPTRIRALAHVLRPVVEGTR